MEANQRQAWGLSRGWVAMRAAIQDTTETCIGQSGHIWTSRGSLRPKETAPMNVHLGDLEDYVHEKLERGGYGSASEVVREALRTMRERELEDAIERRLQAYVMKGIDQGAPEGLDAAQWARRIEATRARLGTFIQEGIDEADRGELIDGEEAFSELRTKQVARRKRRKG